ncbi:MAG: cytochrome P450 [Microthrixaceae bacterium]
MTVPPAIGLLADPNTFVNGVPHDQIAALRATTPVAWQPMLDEPGFWAILTHADVVRVSRSPNLFSAREGGVVLENLAESSLEMMRMMLLAMDPPMHNEYRRPLSEPFKGKIIAGLEPRITEICRELMADVASSGTVEFVHEVTSGLPTKVMGQLMGLPEEDWELLHALAERQTSASDPEIVGDEPDYSASIDMAMYAIEFAAMRRSQPPREDLTTLILDGEFGGQPMSDVDFGSFFVQIVTAGNDTTKSMLSSGLWALLQHPEQMQELRENPTLIPGAVEEILRWVNPLHYFRRTATEDTEIGGVHIQQGDKVVMYYTSANRDESVFDEPHKFNIHRNPNPHLSFGIAEHFCLGVHLARLEGRVFFTELLRSFAKIELAAEPTRIRSNLNNSFKKLPVRLLEFQR